MATIKISETIEKEIEITFPYCSKSICYAYAVLNEATVIQLQLDKTAIEIHHNVALALRQTCEQITYAEFMVLYNLLMDNIRLCEKELINYDVR